MSDEREDPWAYGVTADDAEGPRPTPDVEAEAEPADAIGESRHHTGRFTSPSLGAYSPDAEHAALSGDSGADDEYFRQFGYGEGFGDGRLAADYDPAAPAGSPAPSPSTSTGPAPTSTGPVPNATEPVPTPSWGAGGAVPPPERGVRGAEPDDPSNPGPAPIGGSERRPGLDRTTALDRAARPDGIDGAGAIDRAGRPGGVDGAGAIDRTGRLDGVGGAGASDRTGRLDGVGGVGAVGGVGRIDGADGNGRLRGTDPFDGLGSFDGDLEDDLDEEELDNAAAARRNLIEWGVVLVGAVLLALVLRALVLQAFWIPSPSMETTLLVRDRVLVNKVSYRIGDINRGDVIVFRRTDEEIERNPELPRDVIKRVIALGGEEIEIIDNEVFIDGLLLQEPYLDVGVTTSNFGPETVPEGHVFVMGDNRELSLDSRFETGPIAEDRVVGRAFFLFWPLDRLGPL